MQLINCTGAPTTSSPPAIRAPTPTSSRRAGLDDIADYADGVGLCKDVLIPRDAAGNLTAPTAVIPDAHREDLDVHGWTFRRENQFLPTAFRVGHRPDGIGDIVGEIQVFLDAGMDGFFTDNPDLGVTAARLSGQRPRSPANWSSGTVVAHRRRTAPVLHE